MSLKIPFPVAKKKPVSTRKTDVERIYGLPSFNKHEFKEMTLIGEGSFGKVFKARKDEQWFVIKELKNGSSTGRMLKLFRKEAQLLNSLSGHNNILHFYGFSKEGNSILVEYVHFTFYTIGIQHDTVNNLKELLLACDEISDFKDFQHMQYHLARDVVGGLAYLHEQGIAHRDLKPDNILVSNEHYRHRSKKKIARLWSTNPVIAKLTDFGESRSAMIQTNTICRTSTRNLNRGSPVYMAPEALTNTDGNASIVQLQQMDVWSLGMVFYHLINPNCKYPYAVELEKKYDQIAELKKIMRKLKRPRHLPKYREMCKNFWPELKIAFKMCTTFDERPSTQTIKDHID